MKHLRLFLWRLTGRLPIVVSKVGGDGPPWLASIRGIGLSSGGWTYEGALAALIEKYRFELGLIITGDDEHETNPPLRGHIPKKGDFNRALS